MKIAAVGDVMLGDRPLMVGLGVRSHTESSMSYDPLGRVTNILKEHDIVFGNLEAVISDHGIIHNCHKSVQMRGGERSVNFLKNAGFNVMSVANNHIMQHGKKAFEDTVADLTENGITAIGTKSPTGQSELKFKRVSGRQVGFIGFSMWPDKYCNHVEYSQCDFEEILSRVKACKKQCDILIVSLHWGHEYMSSPSRQQVVQARRLADAGAALVLGHHPHVVQGVEKYNNSIIAYSLGNFVFDVWQKRLRQSFILVVDFSRVAEPEFKRIPIWIDRKFRPVIPEPPRDTMLAKKFSRLDQLIIRNLRSTLFSRNIYADQVKLVEIRNKIENRILFVYNFFKYAPWVRKQSIANFINARIKHNIHVD